MEKKNKVIIGLLVVAVVLFGIIQFVIIPANQKKQSEFEKNQTDALTHDITAIEDYRSQYISEASNVSQLFYALPLGNISKKYEINSKECSLTVSYLDTVWNIGEEKVRRDLVYNTVVAMAAIDNLSAVAYEFSGDSFHFTREQIENELGTNLSEILKEDIWKERVQDKIGSINFINQFYVEN